MIVTFRLIILIHVTLSMFSAMMYSLVIKVIDNYNIVSVDPYNAIKLFNKLIPYNNPFLNVIELDDDSSPIFAVYKEAYQRTNLEELFDEKSESKEKFVQELEFEIVNSGTHRFITHTLKINTYLEISFNEGETVDEFVVRAEKELDELAVDKEKRAEYMHRLDIKYFKPKETFDGLDIMNSMIRRDPERK